MKFQFNPDLSYQKEATASIVDIFEGTFELNRKWL